LAGPARAGVVAAVVPPAARAHVRHASARRAPGDRAPRRIAGGTQADGEEILVLIELQRGGVRNDDQLTDDCVLPGGGHRNLAADDHGGSDSRGGANHGQVFEPRQPSGQLEGERHRQPPGIRTQAGPSTLDPSGRSLAARQAWRRVSAIAPWLCVAVFRRVCSEQRALEEAPRRSALPLPRNYPDGPKSAVTRITGRAATLSVARTTHLSPDYHPHPVAPQFAQHPSLPA